MNFFKTLAETGIENVVIEVKKAKDSEEITVFITPKSTTNSEAIKKLKPIFVTGKPEDIDQEFFPLVSAPLADTQKVFSNIAEFEAQKAELLKEAKAKSGKGKTSAKTADSESDDEGAEEEEVVAKAKPAKVEKINHEKILKDFMLEIKGQDILLHQERIGELMANLSEAELAKSFAKAVKGDLDKAIAKKKAIDDAKLKFGFTAPAETSESINSPEAPVAEFVEEEIISAPLTTKESFAAKNAEAIEVVSPNVESPGQEEEIVPKATTIPAPAPVAVPTAPIPAPPVMAPPVPEVPKTKIIQVQELVMIVNDATYQDYLSVGWTDEQLIQHGKAEYQMVSKEVPFDKAE